MGGAYYFLMEIETLLGENLNCLTVLIMSFNLKQCKWGVRAHGRFYNLCVGCEFFLATGSR